MTSAWSSTEDCKGSKDRGSERTKGKGDDRGGSRESKLL